MRKISRLKAPVYWIQMKQKEWLDPVVRIVVIVIVSVDSFVNIIMDAAQLEIAKMGVFA